MRPLPLLLAGALACAPSVPDPEPTRVLVTDESGTVYRTANDDRGADAVVAAPPSRVAAALQAAYAELGIVAAVAPGTPGRVGNANFQGSRKLAGRSMSAFFDCGSSITGPRTDRMRLTISLVSSYAASGDSTLVRTLLSGVGHDPAEGASTDVIQCRSTGQLERLVNERMQARLRAGA